MTDGSWHPDVLGAGWEARTLPLRADRQGADPVATLVRRVARPEDPTARGAVLHVHGYVDYVFHAHLGDALADAGWAYRGLDLRDHGRSIRPGRLPNFTDDLACYAEELDLAVRLLREEGHERVVVLGHSTGGLLVTLWAHHRRDRPAGPPADALVLNSPWFDLNRGWFDRVVTTRLNRVLARVVPHAVVGNLGESYGRWLHDPEGGGWAYEQEWKPDGGFGARSAWLDSVRRGHAAVAAGLDVPVPVLVCTSDASGPADRMHPAIDRTDSVLDVEHMWERAPRVGADVTVVRIRGGVHDLALSPEPARSTFITTVQEWMAQRL